MEFDLSEIENNLIGFYSKAEKINYLTHIIASHKKALIEFEFSNSSKLERLKNNTSIDFEKYQHQVEIGNFIYFEESQNENIAKRVGFENINLLIERIKLDFDYNFLLNKVKLFLAKKEEIENTIETNIHSKLDFTKEKLRIVILDLAKQNGYENPSTYLDEILIKVKTFDNLDFTSTFFLNIHHLCNEYQNEFWSDSHKKDITNWLNKAPFNPIFSTPEKDIPLFSTTWEPTTTNPPKEIEKGKDKKQQKIITDFIFNVNDKELFLSDLIKTFKAEKGQEIKVIINELETCELVIINSRGFKEFYNLLTDTFKRDIGTYQSINDTKSIHNDIQKPILEKLNPLILKHKQSS
jgi:hypothetical protein